MSSADLSGADLRWCVLVDSDVRLARIVNCRVHGMSVWNLKNSAEARQHNLIVTKENEPAITVDNLEVAQFIYLLLNNERIRSVIDTITSKVVLVLGRFAPRQKAILDVIRKELRKKKYDYVPVVFDFDKPTTRDTEETITLLARMARFIVADISNPRSVPHELGAIVRDLPSVPVQPILRHGCKPWGMYDHIKAYPWVLPLCRYRGAGDLLRRLPRDVIAAAEARTKR